MKEKNKLQMLAALFAATLSMALTSPIAAKANEEYNVEKEEAVVAETGRIYYLKNSHGDVIGQMDENGNVLTSYAYNAFGEQISAVAIQGETFISPTQEYASNYDGTTVKFQVTSGTTNSLLQYGVGNNTTQSVKDYGVLPQVSSGWSVNNVYFKGEGLQTNIGLGQGVGLETFNSSIVSYAIME